MCQERWWCRSGWKAEIVRNNWYHCYARNVQFSLTRKIKVSLLNSNSFTVSFSIDVCRSMVAMLDTDNSGKLGILELKKLLHNIFKWNTVFRTYDLDKSGHLSAFELREALNAAGFKLNNRVLTALTHRYSSRDGTISFVDFIMCAAKIKTMIGKFKWMLCCIHYK